MLKTRRGVALAEAVIAATLGVAVLGLGLRTFLVLQRVVRQEQDRGLARATLLEAAHLLRAELGDTDPAAGDLEVVGPGRVVYHAVRGTGLVCAVAGDGPVVGTASFRALRLPSPGRDSILILPPDAPDGWLRAPITGPPRAAVCPGGRPGLALPAPVPGGAAEGAFVRIFETVELRFYTSGGEWWLGLRSVSGGETTQPVAGPFVAGRFGFEYLDRSGSPTADRRAVRTMVLRGAARAGPGGALDTLTVAVPLAGAGVP